MLTLLMGLLLSAVAFSSNVITTGENVYKPSEMRVDSLTKMELKCSGMEVSDLSHGHINDSVFDGFVSEITGCDLINEDIPNKGSYFDRHRKKWVHLIGRISVYNRQKIQYDSPLICHRKKWVIHS